MLLFETNTDGSLKALECNGQRTDALGNRINIYTDITPKARNFAIQAAKRLRQQAIDSAIKNPEKYGF